MGSKYTMKSFLRDRERKKAMQQVNQTALEQAAQMFLDMYMAPGDFSDAPYRLGRAVDRTNEEITIDSSMFPPYTVTSVTHPELPARIGGFKLVNDRIIELQNLLRITSGEIRTKITEWDVSLYIQEEIFGKDELLNYSLMYRLMQDNPRRYRDSRAFVFGIINTALSSSRWARWNPRSDPDLRYWTQPTASLNLWSRPPRRWKVRVRQVRYVWRWFRRRKRVSYRTVWRTERRPRLNALQQREVHFALQAKWKNWYPPYWQLFFWSSDLNSLGETDEQEFSNSLNDRRQSKWNDDARSSNTPGTGSFGRFSPSRFERAKKRRSESRDSAIDSIAAASSSSGGIIGEKQARDTGINTRSPIFYGRPVGRYKDPRSLAGYLENNPLDRRLPKFAPTTSDRHVANRPYYGINPTEGLRRVLYGWQSTFRARRFKTVWRLVWHSTPCYDNDDNRSWSYRTNYRHWNPHTSRYEYYRPRRYRYRRRVRVSHRYGWQVYSRSRYTYQWYYKCGYYAWKQFQVPYWMTIARTGEYPAATFTVRWHRDPVRTVWRRLTRWFWPYRARYAHRIPPRIDYVINSIKNAPDLNSKVVMDDRVPVIMVSRDKRSVITVPIYRSVYWTSYRVRIRVGWRRRTVTRYRSHPCYKIQTSGLQQYAVGLKSPRPSRWVWWRRRRTPSQTRTTNYWAYPRYVTQLIGPGRSMSFRGLYFSVPARAFSPTTNVVTGWANTDYAVMARGLTTGMWTYGRGLIGSPLQANLAGLYKKTAPVLPALQKLHSLFSKVDSDTILHLFRTLEKKRQRRSDVRRAKAILTGRRLQTVINHLQRTITELDNLLSHLSPIAANGESALTYEHVMYIYQNYPRVAPLVLSPLIKQMVQAYLTLLYEWRLSYMKKRINKVDGTLVQIARIEVALALMGDASSDPADIDSAVIDEVLAVVHKTTTVPLKVKADAKRTNTALPEERVQYVYVPVQYGDDGSIVRHKAGEYQLISREYSDSDTIPEVRFYITFEGPAQPPIVKNVMTTVNQTTLQQIMADPNLTMLEKVCAAREVEDWWKIEIPSKIRPLTEDYETDLILMMTPTDKRISDTGELLGGLTTSPILEIQDKEIPGSTWLTSQDVISKITTSLSSSDKNK